jgi:chromosome partitioning protein
LVIDLDPHGNASTALGIDHHGDIPGIYEVLIGEASLRDVLKPSTEPGELFCVPSTIHLAGAEIDIIEMERREFLLRTALEQLLSDPSNGFHYVFIDCPPSLGLLTVNAFVAAQEVLLPIQCEYYALEGLSQLLRTVEMVKTHLNPKLEVSAILLTMYDGRTRLASQVVDEVRMHFGTRVLNTVIPRAVRVSEAPSFGQTIMTYDGSSPGALTYREASDEFAAIVPLGQVTA